jgi:flagellin FlaB
MYRLLARRLNKSQRAITGIETAIILIAFVVVAAVFSYVAVSSGLFATQKSQEAIYNGLQEAQGATVIRGGIVCMAENIGESGYISQMTFTLSNAMAPTDRLYRSLP